MFCWLASSTSFFARKKTETTYKPGLVEIEKQMINPTHIELGMQWRECFSHRRFTLFQVNKKKQRILLCRLNSDKK